MSITSCPRCGGRVRSVSIGWKCESCQGFIDMRGEFHQNKEEPFMPPMTNAYRIRSMSDEELAVFLDDLTCLCVDCNDHDGVNENCPIYKQGCGRYCEPKDLMDWLQQPAEEDT